MNDTENPRLRMLELALADLSARLETFPKGHARIAMILPMIRKIEDEIDSLTT